MERQIDSFRFRIQRELTTLDDEILRMQKLSNSYNEKIEESKEKLRRLTVYTDFTKQTKTGARNKLNAVIGMIQARAKNNQNQRIQELENLHNKEIVDLQKEFQAKLADINGSIQYAVDTKIQEIEKRTQKLQEFKKDLTRKLSRISSTPQFVERDSWKEDLEENRIQELRSRVLNINADRLTSIRRNKMQLQKCIESLEAMEAKFETAFSEKMIQIKNLDYLHSMHIKNMAQQHENEMSVLKIKLKGAKDSNNQLDRTRQSIDTRGRAALNNAVEEYQTIKSSNMKIAEQQDEETTENDNLKIILENRIKLLKQCEVSLAAAREDNISLKRQIEEKKHQMKFGVH